MTKSKKDMIMKKLFFLLVTILILSPVYSDSAVVGDINGDGRIDTSEAIFALQVAAGLYPGVQTSCLLNGKGSWSAGTAYIECDVVSYEDITGGDTYFYVALTSHSSLTSPDINTADWSQLTLKGEKGDTGNNGLNCWDLNANGACDIATEDLDSNNVCDTADCQAASHEIEICETFYNLDVTFPQFCQDFCSNQSPPDYCTEKIVFVTSSTYNGNLNGLSGADGRCQSLAQIANLTGTFKAWLSSGGSSAKDRLTHNTGPYVLPDGTVVAKHWDDLTDGTLKANINVTEASSPAGSSNSVWTYTTTSGSAIGGGTNCSNWTATGNVFSTKDGRTGTLTSSSSGWTEAGYSDCRNDSHLYCFEQ
ncbi:MAG: hypothetical protein GY702_16845 [Desulfobulbaceae bacterium]|nr:hypothetical protein [Desulfobulbaceae bacterium]